MVRRHAELGIFAAEEAQECHSEIRLGAPFRRDRFRPNMCKETPLHNHLAGDYVPELGFEAESVPLVSSGKVLMRVAQGGRENGYDVLHMNILGIQANSPRHCPNLAEFCQLRPKIGRRRADLLYPPLTVLPCVA